MTLFVAAKHGIANPSATISEVGSPLLLVPNDSAFLAIIAPLSLMLLLRNPRSMAGVLGAASILLSAGAIICLRSRTALLAMVVSLTCGIAFSKSSHRLALTMLCAAIALLLALLIDGVLGFALITKSLNLSQFVEGRRWGP
jgi:hypothetical protein